MQGSYDLHHRWHRQSPPIHTVRTICDFPISNIRADRVTLHRNRRTSSSEWWLLGPRMCHSAHFGISMGTINSILLIPHKSGYVMTYHNIEPCADHESNTLADDRHQNVDCEEHVEPEQFERLTRDHVNDKRKDEGAECLKRKSILYADHVIGFDQLRYLPLSADPVMLRTCSMPWVSTIDWNALSTGFPFLLELFFGIGKSD